MISRRNLLRRAGSGALAAGIGATLQLAPAVAGSTVLHPDAELLAIGREFEAACSACDAAFAANPEMDDDEADIWGSLPFDVARRMVSWRPTSLDGFAVKLRAYIYCSFDKTLDGSPDLDASGEFAGRALIRSLHHDLCALGGQS